MTTTAGSKIVTSLVASIPVLICFRDNVFSLCQVRGSSMEPTLHDGDILLVRKADFPLLTTRMRVRDPHKVRDDTRSLLKNPSGDNKLHHHDDDEEDEMQRRHVRELEYQHFMARENQGVWVRWPPTPVRGQIITYHSPDVYPPDLVIKRVIGVAGQVVRFV